MLKGQVIRPGIDFIIVIFYRFGYAQILAESIKRFVKDIPYTINGKKVEIAVKNIIINKEVINKESLANPNSLELFKELDELSC